MAVQPTGTVTLLFTGVEGSTRPLERLGSERYADALLGHRVLLQEAFELHGGYEVDEEGDARPRDEVVGRSQRAGLGDTPA